MLLPGIGVGLSKDFPHSFHHAATIATTINTPIAITMRRPVRLMRDMEF